MSVASPPSKHLTEVALALADAVKGAQIAPDTPFRDVSREAPLVGLPEFEPVQLALKASTRLRRLYGNKSQRLTLAWAYSSAAPGNSAIQWRDFWKELTDETWRYVSVANLTNYDSAIGDCEISNGVDIRARRLSDLSTALGWSYDDLQQTLGQDWMLTGAGEYILLVSTSIPKDPTTVMQSNTGIEAVAVARALMAMRIAGEGDVGVGTVFTTRVSKPLMLLFGRMSSPPVLAFGSGTQYVMNQERLRSIRLIFSQLSSLEARPQTTFSELRSALDRFRAAFDRPWIALADRIIDDVIALEAIAVVSTELSYTISVRVSGMLADSDVDRVDLFKLLKAFYAVRSTIVHGGRLKPAAQALLAREPELRNVVRSVLRGLLNLVDSAAMQPRGNSWVGD